MTIKNNLVGAASVAAICMSFVACGPSTTKKPDSFPPRTEQIISGDMLGLLRTEKIGIAPGFFTEDFEVGGIVVGDMISAANYVLPDSKYLIVDEEWFNDNILNTLDFKEFLFRNGIENYSSLRNDCDDFARAFSFYVRIKFRTMGVKDSTPAVGDLYYSTPQDGTAELGGGHAINVGVFLDKNGKKIIRFIEPQGTAPHFVELDDETRKYYIRFLGM